MWRWKRGGSFSVVDHVDSELWAPFVQSSDVELGVERTLALITWERIQCCHRPVRFRVQLCHVSRLSHQPFRSDLLSDPPTFSLDQLEVTFVVEGGTLSRERQSLVSRQVILFNTAQHTPQSLDISSHIHFVV